MLSEKSIECPQVLLNLAKKTGPVKTAIVSVSSLISLDSARKSADAGLAWPILIGNSNVIEKLAAGINWKRDSYEILHVNSETEAAALAVALVREGKADALMKGDIHTDIFMGAIVNRDTGIRDGQRLCHAFYLTTPDSTKSLIISDAAVNILPDFKTKQAIIKATVSLAHALGNSQPKVAILSATEEINFAMPSSGEAAELSKWANENVSGALYCGPLAMDNAISPLAAKIKNISNPVAGQADILVMPNIEAGNILFKTLVYFNSACPAGIVMGAKVPIVLTSRADPPEARLASMAIAAILASNSTN